MNIYKCLFFLPFSPRLPNLQTHCSLQTSRAAGMGMENYIKPPNLQVLLTGKDLQTCFPID